jgi:hypothetical protein
LLADREEAPNVFLTGVADSKMNIEHLPLGSIEGIISKFDELLVDYVVVPKPILRCQRDAQRR